MQFYIVEWHTAFSGFDAKCHEVTPEPSGWGGLLPRQVPGGLAPPPTLPPASESSTHFFLYFSVQQVRSCW